MTTDSSVLRPYPVPAQSAHTSLDLLAPALELVDRGWSVLPLRGKLPLTRHGKDDATTDAALVKRWWTRWPWANIGVRVPDAFVVVDVDPRNGGLDGMAAIEAQVGLIPATLTVWSGRNDGGRHLYFWHPGGKVTGRGLPPGLDLKTSHGYVLVPPSQHPETGLPYTWDIRSVACLPSELLGVIRPRHAAASAIGRVPAGTLPAFVEQLDEGNRNNGLFWAACRAAEAGQLHLLGDRLVAAAIAVGLTEQSARATVGSARVTASTSSAPKGSNR